jgi:FkbM family methyltransferase
MGRTHLVSGLRQFLGASKSSSNQAGPRDPVNAAIAEAHRDWVAAKGDRTLRLNYDLSPHSVVLDVGGFEGQWASDIFGMYLCDVHVFEPVKEHFELLSLRYLRNKNIHVYPFGLGASHRKESIAVAGDASSFMRTGADEAEWVDIVAASEFLNEHFPGSIDLIKINIEGAEYELLEHLIGDGIIARLKNIQVQFHDFVPHAVERMRQIQKELGATHRLTYQYLFVWENWQIKNES